MRGVSLIYLIPYTGLLDVRKGAGTTHHGLDIRFWVIFTCYARRLDVESSSVSVNLIIASSLPQGYLFNFHI